MTLFLVGSTVFALFFVLPGARGDRPRGGISPIAVLLAGRRSPISEMRSIERRLGLDEPLPVQYARYMSGLARGDLGYSFSAEVPVWHIIKPAIPPSVSLAVGASLIWVACGVGLGVLSAHRRGTLQARMAMGSALVALSLPGFVTALVGISVILRLSGVYAGNRYVGLTEDPLAWLQAMSLPWVCLALPLIAVYGRMTRAALLEVQAEDYIHAATARGLTDRQVLRHELRSALTPIVTLYGLDLGILVGGSVVMERIFNIPGLGSLLLAARDFSDFPVMAGVVIVASVAVMLSTLIIDLSYALLDPRIRSSSTG